MRCCPDTDSKVEKNFDDFIFVFLPCLFFYLIDLFINFYHMRNIYKREESLNQLYIISLKLFSLLSGLQRNQTVSMDETQIVAEFKK